MTVPPLPSTRHCLKILNIEVKLFIISNDSLIVLPALNGQTLKKVALARLRVLLCPLGGASDGTKPRQIYENQKMPLTGHNSPCEDCRSLLCECPGVEESAYKCEDTGKAS